MTTARSALDVLAERYGQNVSYEESPEGSEVGVASAVLVPANPQRVSLTIINMSANTVYVRPRRPALATGSIVLVPAGGHTSVDLDSDTVLPIFDWHAIASGANSDVYWVGTVLT